MGLWDILSANAPLLLMAAALIGAVIWLIVRNPAGSVTIAPVTGTTTKPTLAPETPCPSPSMSAVLPTTAPDESDAVINAYNAEVPAEGFVEYKMRGNKLILGAPWAKV